MLSHKYSVTLTSREQTAYIAPRNEVVALAGPTAVIGTGVDRSSGRGEIHDAPIHVGINVAGKRQSVTVSAEDALAAALKVKNEKPKATINYIRRSNKRGDRCHPHSPIAADVH